MQSPLSNRHWIYNANYWKTRSMKQTFKLIVSFISGIGIGLSILLFILFISKGFSWDNSFAVVKKIEWSTFIIVAVGAFISIIASIFLQIMIHETGHLIFGRLSGYQFVSFRIGKYTLIKENHRFRIKQFAIAGTGGQCLMTLPDHNNDSIPYFWYNIGGCLSNLIISLITLTLWFTIDLPIYVDAFFIIFSIIGIAMAIFNGVPMKLGGIGNDGFTIKEMTKHHESRRYFVNQLRVNAANQEGIRLKDMPNEWIISKEDINFSNAIELSNYNLYASRFIDNKCFDQALPLFRKAYDQRTSIIGLFQKEIACELLFLELIGDNNSDQVKLLYTDELKKYINDFSKWMSSKQRLQMVLALYHEHNYDKAVDIYMSFLSKRELYIHKGEYMSDLDIMKYCLDNYNIKTDTK